jgi:hypothetical protein
MRLKQDDYDTLGDDPLEKKTQEAELEGNAPTL